MVEEKLEWVLLSYPEYKPVFEGFKLPLPEGKFSSRKEALNCIRTCKKRLERYPQSPYKSIRCVTMLEGIGVRCRVVYEFSIGGPINIDDDTQEINGKLRRERGLPKLATTIRTWETK